MKKYPECFPENFETDILPKDAKKENKSVYRVIKFGTIDSGSIPSLYCLHSFILNATDLSLPL